MFFFQLEMNGFQLYDKWYNIIIECSLKAGGLIIDQNGHCKRFDFKKKHIVSYRCKKNKTKTRSKP